MSAFALGALVLKHFKLYFQLFVALLLSACTPNGAERVAGGVGYNSYYCDTEEYTLLETVVSEEVLEIRFQCTEFGKVLIDETFNGPNSSEFITALQSARENVFPNITVVTRDNSADIVQIYTLDRISFSYQFFWDTCVECPPK